MRKKNGYGWFTAEYCRSTGMEKGKKIKAVLISIQPKWCELIASGKKTVEVRKTKPKLETPFKCYIYCTKSNGTLFKRNGNKFLGYSLQNVSGMVIGEFVCNCMTGLKADNMVQAYYNNTKDTCLTDEEIKKYANGKKLYYWHISNLVIYDKPKELSEFSKYGFDRFVPWKRPPQSWGYVEEGATDEK